jgi:hypothetical protein
MTRRHPSAAEGLVALFTLVVRVLEVPANIRMYQRKIDIANTRRELEAQRISESRQKQMINEAEIALRNNRAVVVDLDIEIRKLQLEKMRRELGLTSEGEFNEPHCDER